MSDLLESIKQKYSEEVGWSFNFFEGATFMIYLVAAYEILCGSGIGFWKTILTKSVSSIFSGDDSILASARVIDYFIAAGVTIISVYLYRKIRFYSYGYLSSLKNLKAYVDRLKEQYSKNNMSSQAMRIYIANEAKEQKQLHMKKITTINGFGLISLGVVVSSIAGLSMFNLVDLLMLIVGVTGTLFVQWQVFALYTSQVVPRLVLERMAREEPVEFGDEL